MGLRKNIYLCVKTVSQPLWMAYILWPEFLGVKTCILVTMQNQMFAWNHKDFWLFWWLCWYLELIVNSYEEVQNMEKNDMH